MAENNLIGISGLLGAGKTSLATELGKVLNLPLYYEPIIEKEYLEDFYKDMKRYSFSFKVYLLNCRFRKYQQVIWNGGDGIQDWTLYEDSIFAKVLYEEGYMDERLYKTYLNLFRNMSNFMKKNKLYNIYEEYMKEISKVILVMRVKTEFENKHTIKDVDNLKLHINKI